MKTIKISVVTFIKKSSLLPDRKEAWAVGRDFQLILSGPDPSNSLDFIVFIVA